jgi:mRNA-degrading endonuclease toxin of MazEF toxin-antitoxin module
MRAVRTAGSVDIARSCCMTVDKQILTARVGRLPKAKLQLLLRGIDVILGK